MNLAILEFESVYVFILRGIVSVRMQHMYIFQSLCGLQNNCSIDLQHDIFTSD